MKTIKVIDGSYTLPKKHKLSKENRKVIIKTPFTTVIRRLWKDGFQETIQKFYLNKRRKGMEDDVLELNGERFKVKFANELNGVKEKWNL